MAILVLFEQFLGKFCLIFLPLNLSFSPHMMHFARTFSIMRVLGIRLIVVEKVRNYGKIVFIETCLKMAGEWDASPTFPLDPPLPAMITMFLTTTPTSQFGFSMMQG